MPKSFKSFEGNNKLGVPISPNHYAGGGHLGDDRPQGLSNVIRGLAIDHARARVNTTDIADFTDSSGGVVNVSGVNVALVIPAAAFDGQSSDASPATAFNTAAGVIENVMAVMADTFNEVAGRLGLRQIGFTTGTIATADTIPVLTTSLTATSGSNAIGFVQGIARMTSIRNNYATLHRAMNQISNALGFDTIADNSGGAADISKPPVLAAIADADAGTGDTAGETSISDTVMDAFLLAVAANVATLAKHYSDMFSGSGTGDITNSVGGSATNAVADMGTMTAHQDDSTNSSPKAGFDTEVAKWRKDFAEIVTKLNLLGQPHGLTDLLDNTAGTANGTADAISVALTAVDGTGNNSLEVVTALATWDIVKDNIATVISRINELVGFFGAQPIVDSSGGTADVVTFDVVAMPASGSGVDNGAATTGVADAEVDANLVVLRNALTSMVAKTSEMTGTFEGVAKIASGFPLCVVASA